MSALLVACAVASFSFFVGATKAGEDHAYPSASDGAGAARVWRLSYRIPEGWVSDRDRAARMGLSALLLPAGRRVEEAETYITVAFHARHPGRPGPTTLEQFFKAEMAKLLYFFPDVESERWRPSSLDPAEVEFASLEVYGQEEGRPPPGRVVMIDSGDGYISIGLTAKTRAALDRPDVSEFFDSLLLLPSRRPPRAEASAPARTGGEQGGRE